MEVLDEVRVGAERVEDTYVVMVGLGGGEQDNDARALGCYGQAVGEGIVGGPGQVAAGPAVGCTVA